MKKNILIVLTLLILLATACSSGQASSAQNQSLSVQTELMVGTLKLKGTDQEVTAQQAAALLPLWEVMKDLNSSDTAAQQEIDALVDQIRGTMTSGQLQAISNMKLSQQDVMAAAQGQALTSGNAQKSSSQSQSSGGGFGGPPPGGGDLGGILAGGGPGTGVSNNSSTAATPQAVNSKQAPDGLIDALIEYLKGKASS